MMNKNIAKGAKPGNAVVQDSISDPCCWLSFTSPYRIVQSNSLSEVVDHLREIELEVANGAYAVGFVSYDAAPALDSSLLAHAAKDFPFLWFGLYRHCNKLECMPDIKGDEYSLADWQPSLSWSNYQAAIDSIKQHIHDGDTYQVNYTHKLVAKFQGDPWTMFIDLYRAQQSRYSAYIDMGRYQVLSVSPELFLQRSKNSLLSKPMKGTIARGISAEQDKSNINWLRNSAKNRAENLMIVDMLRNDMGKIADTGSVDVQHLFDIESYPTVYQMTSTVKANTSKKISEILSAMFPCASVTGAPKAKTMQIIKQLEPQSRGVYTGSIGFLKPDGSSQFNVAIRTVLVDSQNNRAEYGVGGGIVWDSNAESEYDECKIKAAVLMQPASGFKLLETLLWQAGKGYLFLEEHLQRLQRSAEYFAFAINLAYIEEQLMSLAASLLVDTRVRMMVAAHNNVELQASTLKSLYNSKVVLDDLKSNTQSDYCYHKTTHRDIYQQALDRHDGYQDVILINQNGYVTESTMANIVAEIDGELRTPAGQSGLLAGVFRQYLLQQGVIHESQITIYQLLEARRIYLINSVRGWMPLHKTGDSSWQIQLGSANFCINPEPEEVLE